MQGPACVVNDVVKRYIARPKRCQSEHERVLRTDPWVRRREEPLVREHFIEQDLRRRLTAHRIGEFRQRVSRRRIERIERRSALIGIARLIEQTCSKQDVCARCLHPGIAGVRRGCAFEKRPRLVDASVQPLRAWHAHVVTGRGQVRQRRRVETGGLARLAKGARPLLLCCP